MLFRLQQLLSLATHSYSPSIQRFCTGAGGHLFGQAVAEIVLAELVELVSLWAAGEAQWAAELGTDGAVAGWFLESCVLEPLLMDGQ